MRQDDLACQGQLGGSWRLLNRETLNCILILGLERVPVDPKSYRFKGQTL